MLKRRVPQTVYSVWIATNYVNSKYRWSHFNVKTKYFGLVFYSGLHTGYRKIKQAHDILIFYQNQ